MEILALRKSSFVDDLKTFRGRLIKMETQVSNKKLFKKKIENKSFKKGKYKVSNRNNNNENRKNTLKMKLKHLKLEILRCNENRKYNVSELICHRGLCGRLE
jgi:hypothetical protein